MDDVAESPSVSKRAGLLRFITLEQLRHLPLLCAVLSLVVNEPSESYCFITYMCERDCE